MTATAPAGERAAPSRPPRVLLVQALGDDRRVTERALVEAGLQVDRVDDGRAALAAMEHEGYALVIFDLPPPDLDALHTAAAIRAREAELELERAPIIALTPHAVEAHARQRALDAGVDELLPQPSPEPRELRAQVERWIDPRPLILLADDSPEIRELVRTYLARDGRFRLITARDGHAAVDRFPRRPFSAVILDIEMPTFDGYAVAASLRATPRGRELPIIALTGHDDPAAEARCLSAGFSHFLPKPVRRDRLLATLSGVLK